MLYQKIPRLIVQNVFLLSLVVSACNQILPENQKTKGDTLVISDYQKPGYINPILTSTTLSARLSELVFDGLVRIDEHLEAKPNLALKWDLSEDKKTWIFHLRQDVHFHDGKNLTADDVSFTLRYLADGKSNFMGTYAFEEVEKILIKDKYTISITLMKPLSSFLEKMQIGILPRHLLEGKRVDSPLFNQKPIGTGPFKVISWSTDEIILGANTAYYLGGPYLNRIWVRYIKSRKSAWAKLFSGEIDFVDSLSPDNYETLKNIRSFQLYSVPMPYYYIVAFNLRSDLFRNKEVRLALNYAINRSELIDKVLSGQGQPAASSIYPTSWAYNPKITPYPFNPQMALEMLSKEGYQDHDGDHLLDKNGEPFEFDVLINSGDDIKEKVLNYIQQQLFDAGIKMNIKSFDASQSTLLFSKRFDAHFPEIDSFGDPDINYRYWHSSQIDQGFNVSSYRNSDIDRLLDEGRREFDPDKRKEIYFAFQKAIHDDPPGIFLFWTNYLVGVHKRFKDVKISPAGPFSNIREWYVPEQEQRSPVIPAPESFASHE